MPNYCPLMSSNAPSKQHRIEAMMLSEQMKSVLKTLIFDK